MKKLLILSLVLGIASLANAGLSLTVDGVAAGGEITIAPSDNIMLGIVSDVQGQTGDTGQYDALLVITDLALGSWTGVIQLGPAAIPDAFGVIDPDGDDPSLALFVNSDGIPTTLADAGLGAEFEFHCEGEGDVVVLLVDLVTGEEIPLMIHQEVPEPATMGLLALGGLFLRRRK